MIRLRCGSQHQVCGLKISISLARNLVDEADVCGEGYSSESLGSLVASGSTLLFSGLSITRTESLRSKISGSSSVRSATKRKMDDCLFRCWYEPLGGEKKNIPSSRLF